MSAEQEEDQEAEAMADADVIRKLSSYIWVLN